jgi:hypothetical protein
MNFRLKESHSAAIRQLRLPHAVPPFDINHQPAREGKPMHVKIIPEIWNTLTPQQKRIYADYLQPEKIRRPLDHREITAWLSVFAALLVTGAFSLLLLH